MTIGASKAAVTWQCQLRAVSRQKKVSNLSYTVFRLFVQSTWRWHCGISVNSRTQSYHTVIPHCHTTLSYHTVIPPLLKNTKHRRKKYSLRHERKHVEIYFHSSRTSSGHILVQDTCTQQQEQPEWKLLKELLPHMHLMACLHVTCACPFTSTSTSTLTLC